MEDLHREIEDLRFDIQTLRRMVDVALDSGITADDLMLRACANVLYDRRAHLENLERSLTNHQTDPEP